MGDKSRIAWTDATWNPVTGCTKVSAGCKHCYAERMAKRLKAMGQKNYANGFGVTTQPHMLDVPLRWKRPRNIFVCSMSDLFHEDVSLDYILRVFETMRKAKQHRFQVLTKRSERMAWIAATIEWPPNVWAGVTTENQAMADKRIPDLLNVPAPLLFVSCEPLLGPIDLKMPRACLPQIGWVIAGCESGPGARHMRKGWTRSLRDQCQEASVPFFLKQSIVDCKLTHIPELDGRKWEEIPKEG